MAPTKAKWVGPHIEPKHVPVLFRLGFPSDFT